MGEKIKPLFDKPYGPMENYRTNLSMGTVGEALCEMCGTIHPEEPAGSDGHNLIEVLGRMVVMDCCGRLVDVLYEEWGETFTLAFIKEWKQNPLDTRYRFFTMILQEAARRAVVKGNGLVQDVKDISDSVSGLPS